MIADLFAVLEIADVVAAFAGNLGDSGQDGREDGFQDILDFFRVDVIAAGRDFGNGVFRELCSGLIGFQRVDLRLFGCQLRQPAETFCVVDRLEDHGARTVQPPSLHGIVGEADDVVENRVDVTRGSVLFVDDLTVAGLAFLLAGDFGIVFEEAVHRDVVRRFSVPGIRLLLGDQPRADEPCIPHVFDKLDGCFGCVLNAGVLCFEAVERRSHGCSGFQRRVCEDLDTAGLVFERVLDAEIGV